MGKFLNNQTINAENIDKQISGFKDRLNNPYYGFNQEKPNAVTYFNINIDRSSFDETTGLNYASLGKDSSIKYNKINNMLLYGINKWEVNIDTQDVGTEADELQGNAMILPNTITPYAGDYFIFPYVKEELLVRVINAQSDTLDNGANVWVIEYKVEHSSFEGLEENVIEEYEYVTNNVGTAYTPILKKSEYNLVYELDTLAMKIRSFYSSIFYSDRVQSLIFSDKGRLFYDSFLTEFVIRTKILEDVTTDYIYLTHQLNLPKTFAIDYDRSFFNMVEKKDKKNILKAPIFAYGVPIESNVNIFSTRFEQYFELVHENIKGLSPDFSMFLTFDIINNDLLENIDSCTLSDNELDNIIIKYFNDIDLSRNDIEVMDNIDYRDSYELFFKLPIVLFILEYSIKKIMLKERPVK